MILNIVIVRSKARCAGRGKIVYLLAFGAVNFYWRYPGFYSFSKRKRPSSEE
jgi:hypothetical protein